MADDISILLVEDEKDLADALGAGLRREGHTVEVVYDGQAALEAFAAADFDVVLLDRDLPLLSGDAFCRILRSQGHLAQILMLTAAASDNDKVSGLDLGADDYLAKPFSYAELLARLRAMARRLRHLEPLTVAGIQYDPARRTATRGGRVLPLTLKESQLLQALLENGGYLTADELLELVWPEDRSRSVVKATVHTLRQKLGKPDAVHSAPGLGYRIGEAL